MAKKNGFNTKNLAGLITQLNELGVDSAELCQTLVEEAADKVLKKQMNDAPKEKKNAYKHLAVTDFKKYKKGAYANIGIDASNWARTNYLYYQHYGYTHYKSGEKITVHKGWLDDSFNQIKADIRYSFMTALIAKIQSFKVKDGAI